MTWFQFGVFVAGGLLLVAFGWFGHIWYTQVYLVQSPDKELVRVRSIGSAAQARFEHWRARSHLLEIDLKALNQAYDALRRENDNLKAENESMAGLLKDFSSVNSCNLHGNQVYLAARVQNLKACGLNLSQVQKRIKGYRGGAAFYTIRRLYNGDVVPGGKVHKNPYGDDVEICSCTVADWKASESLNDDGDTKEYY